VDEDINESGGGGIEPVKSDPIEGDCAEHLLDIVPATSCVPIDGWGIGGKRSELVLTQPDRLYREAGKSRWDVLECWVHPVQSDVSGRHVYFRICCHCLRGEGYGGSVSTPWVRAIRCVLVSTARLGRRDRLLVTHHSSVPHSSPWPLPHWLRCSSLRTVVFESCSG
jgi:hypothetical protein